MASKSIFIPNALYEPHQRGCEAEEQVALFLHKRGYGVLSRRLKTPYGEVDLLVKSPKGFLVLIEVKTLRRWDWLATRIHRRQLRRLLNCRSYFEGRWNQKVVLYAALVMDKRIQFLPLE